MALFVLDASVAISWCFPGDPTENTPYSRAILKRLAVDQAVVPEIWAFEIAPQHLCVLQQAQKDHRAANP